MRLTCLLLLVGCVGDGASTRPDCAKVLCAEDEYCLYVSGGAGEEDSGWDLPVCTVAPESCDGTPGCDCLSGCTSCEEDDGLVRCHSDVP